jgi:hypothetical protein
LPANSFWPVSAPRVVSGLTTAHLQERDDEPVRLRQQGLNLAAFGPITSDMVAACEGT